MSCFPAIVRSVLLMGGLLLTVQAMGVQAAGVEYPVVEFADLLPDEDFQALSSPPEELAQIEEGSLDDQIASAVAQAVEQAGQAEPQSDWDRALQSTTVRSEFDGRKIRIPGYIVPLEFDDNQVVTEFFLVPYYGACIHLPPPPPNQIILSQSNGGFKLETIYDPFWLEGTLHTELNENDVGISAYRMDVDRMTPYLDESRR